MSSPDSVNRWLHGHRIRPLFPRVLAIVQAQGLDAELAAGIRPSATPAHQARADHLRKLAVRRRIAAALNRAVEAASAPECYEPGKVPLDRKAIRHCHGEIRALAELVAGVDNPRTRGVAIAFQLAFDGDAALFFQPDGQDGVERLAGIVRAASNALKVSADFDEPGR